MGGIKVSDLEDAGTLSEHDVLYLIRRNQVGEFESKQAKLGNLLSLAGGGGGLPDVESTTDTTPIDTNEFYQRVNAMLGAAKPSTPLSNVVMVHQPDEPNNMSMGVITVFPTAKGRYIRANGPGALGGNEMGDFLIYLPDTGAPSFISYLTIPSAVKGEQGEPGVYVTKTKQGPWLRNVGTDWSKDNLHLKTDSVECWKVTTVLDDTLAEENPNVRITLDALPCDTNGNPLPYTLHTQVVSTGATEPLNLVMVLTVHGNATQQLNVSTGTFTPMGVVNTIVYDPAWILTW